MYHGSLPEKIAQIKKMAVKDRHNDFAGTRTCCLPVFSGNLHVPLLPVSLSSLPSLPSSICLPLYLDVVFSTTHKSKGLEWPTVVVCSDYLESQKEDFLLEPERKSGTAWRLIPPTSWYRSI